MEHADLHSVLVLERAFLFSFLVLSGRCLKLLALPFLFLTLVVPCILSWAASWFCYTMISGPIAMEAFQCSSPPVRIHSLRFFRTLCSLTETARVVRA